MTFTFQSIPTDLIRRASDLLWHRNVPHRVCFGKFWLGHDVAISVGYNDDQGYVIKFDDTPNPNIRRLCFAVGHAISDAKRAEQVYKIAKLRGITW